MTDPITFTIWGTNEDPNGNPIPYTRTTQGSQWTPRAVRYQEWKRRVVASYLDALGAIPKVDRAQFGEMHDLLDKKPIKAVKHKQRMEIVCHYKDEKHPDTDNVFKGIADALFMNDKHLVGDLDYDHTERGGVEITLYL